MDNDTNLLAIIEKRAKLLSFRYAVEHGLGDPISYQTKHWAAFMPVAAQDLGNFLGETIIAG